MRCLSCFTGEVYKSRSRNPWYLWSLRWFVVAAQCDYCEDEFRFPGFLLGGPRLESPPAQEIPESEDSDL
jgi:hypothetical protein